MHTFHPSFHPFSFFLAIRSTSTEITFAPSPPTSLNCLLQHKDDEGNSLFKHPYKPWTLKEGDEHDESHFRVFKASENVTEWTNYSLPLVWMGVLFGSEIPVVGAFAPWVVCGMGLVMAKKNVDYVKAYSLSAEKRIPDFQARTNMFKGLLAMSVVGMMATGGNLLMAAMK
jgi:hypothetical protein